MENNATISLPILFLVVFSLFVSSKSFSQRGFYTPLNLDTVHFSLQDFGRMWTFDDVPVERFEEKYNFSPNEDWLEHVQKSALQFGGGCSASFVSANGLIMTNHHCGRNQLHLVQKEGENLLRDGFYSESLKEERKIPGLYVDQLQFIVDVTDSIKSAIAKGKTDNEKVELEKKGISRVAANFSEETGLLCKVVKLYYGGKYSLYGYKRYKDIRLVMSPDFQIAATGWDWDNFTYPRYELDFAFYRAYDENGEPVKVNNYFKWSKSGAGKGEPIFVVGRPGRTSRIFSLAELNYLKNKLYKNILIGFNEIYNVYFELFEKHPERESELLNKVMGWGNARKSYAGRLAALHNKYIMKKKSDFEQNLKKLVHADSLLNKKYSHGWDAISLVVKELEKTADEYYVFSLRRFPQNEYLKIAHKLIKYEEQLKLPEDEREIKYKADSLEQTLNKIYPGKTDSEFTNLLLKAQVNILNNILPKSMPFLKKMLNGETGNKAVKYMLEKSSLTTKQKFNELVKSSPDEILNSDDPFIYYLQYSKKRLKEITKSRTDAINTLNVQNQLLGEIIFAIYGKEIPPDASLTLRISDGVIKGYEYNGTVAPGKTTFYGLWDRYYSFGQKTYPWGLHERWKTPPKGLDLSTSVGFASMNDIVGGNSGSAIINKNAEVVGLVHDGNIESLAGYIIYLPEDNRTVATDSKGLIEALKYIYKTDRLVKELQNGKIVDK